MKIIVDDENKPLPRDETSLERACRRLDDAEREYHNAREIYLSHVTRGLVHSLPELRDVLRARYTAVKSALVLFEIEVFP